jgi:RNA polymerase sigma-70 factor (ECF subfamily)
MAGPIRDPTTTSGQAPTDSELIRQVQAGNSEAFGLLVSRYMRPAYFSALGLVGSREDALDLSQEAFARAFRARRRLDPERPFYAWYYTTLRRLCFNFLRDRRRRETWVAEGSAWIEAAAASAADGPERTAERHDELRRLADAIAALPDHEREVLVLKEFEGLKYREIAERVGVPLGTVMSRLYAARQRLSAVLEGTR